MSWEVPVEMITTLGDLERGNTLIRLRNTVHALALAGALAEAKRRGVTEATREMRLQRANAMVAIMGEVCTQLAPPADDNAACND